MKIMNEYVEALKRDFTWYESSNILYSECVDNEDDLKTLYIVYKKGGDVYKYYGVSVIDYLFIRDAVSQGKECYARLKPYRYENVGKADVQGIERAKDERAGSACCIYETDEVAVVTDGQRNFIAEFSTYTTPSVTKVLDGIGVKYAYQTVLSK